MGVFTALYDAIAPHRARGKAIVLVIDVVILAAFMIGTPLIRRSAYGSLSLGSDLIAAFLIGFTVVVGFNSIVYVGALFSKSVNQET